MSRLLSFLILLWPTSSLLAEAGAEPRAPRWCDLTLVLDAVPARAEWIPWLSVAGGQTRIDGEREASLGLGLGGEVAFGVTQLSRGRHYGGPVVLRGGPWAAALTSLRDHLVEGGAHLSVGQTSHAPFGTYTVRLGAGFGDALGRSGPHLVVSVTGGVHSFLDRYSTRGSCDPAPVPGPHGLGSAFRLVASWRASLEENGGGQWLVGIELTPSYFLPPYSWMRLGGGRPGE